MTRILLVDDHAIVRAGLRALLETADPEMQVAEAENAAEALRRLREQAWDGLILDISLPGKPGLEALKQIHQLYPDLPILVLSIHSDREYGIRALRDGALGYLNKTCSLELLLQAVRQTLNRQHYISPTLAQSLTGTLQKPSPTARHHRLSDREFEVLHLTAAGQTPMQIAERLNLSVKTIHTYRRRIMNKLELENSAELIRYAYRHHLLD